MADNNLLAGTAYLTVDGTRYSLVGETKYSPSKVTRETVKGMDGVHGYKETPVQGSISGKFRDSGSLRVAAFNAMTNGAALGDHVIASLGLTCPTPAQAAS